MTDPFAQEMMTKALAAAKDAAALGEVPVGAVVVDALTRQLLAITHNRVETDKDPTAHAEVLALREAAKAMGSTRLPQCDLYVTLEPCAMCAAAISFARIRRVVFAAYDPKGGAVEHGPKFYRQPTCHHAPEVVGGVREGEGAALLKEFFKGLR